jgi:hypothetical protein
VGEGSGGGGGEDEGEGGDGKRDRGTEMERKWNWKCVVVIALPACLPAGARIRVVSTVGSGSDGDVLIVTCPSGSAFCHCAVLAISSNLEIGYLKVKTITSKSRKWCGILLMS